MYYIYPVKTEAGSYPALQTSSAPGLLEFPEEFFNTFYPADKRFAGFVDIEESEGVVTACVWNEGAYAAYAQTHPEVPDTPPAPTEMERLRADVDYIAMETGVEL